MTDLSIRDATAADVGLIFTFIRELADYERLPHEVVSDESALTQALFGERRFAEVLIAEADGQPAGFALFFHSFSTFLGRPGPQRFYDSLGARPMSEWTTYRLTGEALSKLGRSDAGRGTD